MTASSVILGAGVTGLTTAKSLLERFPSMDPATVIVIAKHLPGDISPTGYCSPQGGANWISFEEKPNQYTQYDRVSFERFLRIAKESPESGVKRFTLRYIYGDLQEQTPNTKMPWYADLVGGVTPIPTEELPRGGVWGLEMETFMFNVPVYLMWLYNALLKMGVRFSRRHYSHIDSVLRDYPTVTALFNCTGLGARYLGGVEDKEVYACKGHTLLVAEPKTPVQKMYVFTESSTFPENEFSHVFPRPLGGGVIIGGIRLDNDESEAIDLSCSDRIKKRACELCPELGKPGELQVISYNIGLRPKRKGGARVEKEIRSGVLFIHNYGAGGAGYQSSWGMAERAVELYSTANQPISKL